jgi:GR25 family glycosyltransferase involved in LPS biosynthesis
MKLNKVYIIHYTKLKDRKENILSMLKNTDYDFEFIENLDQEEITKKDFEKYYFPQKEKFEEKIKPLWDINVHKFRYLNNAEISCTMKHILALEKISNQDEEIGMILEDDAISIEENFQEKIESLIDNAPEDWDSIFMGAGCGIDFMNEKLKNSELLNGNFAKVSHPCTNCAEAYLIKKESAKRIYESIIPFQLVSDWELAYQFYKLNMNVYWSIPPFFYQGSKSGQYDSTLR